VQERLSELCLRGVGSGRTKEADVVRRRHSLTTCRKSSSVNIVKSVDYHV
jgi:hypothetical protein